MANLPEGPLLEMSNLARNTRTLRPTMTRCTANTSLRREWHIFTLTRSRYYLVDVPSALNERNNIDGMLPVTSSLHPTIEADLNKTLETPNRYPDRFD